MISKAAVVFVLFILLKTVNGQPNDISDCTIITYYSDIILPTFLDIAEIIIPTNACETYNRFGLNVTDMKSELQEALKSVANITIDFSDIPDDSCNAAANVTGTLETSDGEIYNVVTRARTYHRSQSAFPGLAYISGMAPLQIYEGSFTITILETDAPQIEVDDVFTAGRFIYVGNATCDEAISCQQQQQYGYYPQNDCINEPIIVKFANKGFGTSFGAYFIDDLALESEEFGEGEMLASLTFDLSGTGFQIKERSVLTFCREYEYR